MIDFVLFDLDGTLTNPKEGITRCVRYGMEALGYPAPPLDELTPFIGPPLLDMYMETCGFTKEQGLLAVAKYRERFGTVGMFENEVYEGIPELLTELKAAGKHLGVATSKPGVFAVPILEHFHLDGYFERIIGSELDGTRVKKGEVITEALRQFGEEETNGRVVMVGDRKHDISGAKENHIPSIGVCYGFGGREELKEAGADHIAETVEELKTLLLSL